MNKTLVTAAGLAAILVVFAVAGMFGAPVAEEYVGHIVAFVLGGAAGEAIRRQSGGSE